jgi:hypothetical protein
MVPEYRQYDVLQRHPATLAFIDDYLINDGLEGAREGYRTVRAELAEHEPGAGVRWGPRH